MDDMKETFREGEETAKETWRKADGESPADAIGNAGDDIRKELGNAGDAIRRETQEGLDDDKATRRMQELYKKSVHPKAAWSQAFSAAERTVARCPPQRVARSSASSQLSGPVRRYQWPPPGDSRHAAPLYSTVMSSRATAGPHSSHATTAGFGL